MQGSYPRLFIKDHFPEGSTNPSGALLMGAGNSTAQPTSSTVDKNFLQFYLKSSATSGTSRGMYLRLYADSGAGGEALRAFTTVSSNTPADTVNGAHISLNFGASAGNVTGEANALRATYHLGKRTMGGTNTAIKAELWSDGTASAAGTKNVSFLRFSNGGNATGLATVNTKGLLFAVDGITAGGDGSNTMFRTAAPTTLAASFKVMVGSTLYYLPLYSAQS